MKVRRDYLPFGEEIPADVASRISVTGYAVIDGTRHKFTQKERDNETGLDFFEARYYASTLGRFTSPDEPFADQEEDDPQSWNLYSYVRNNPLRYIDPSGKGRWELGPDGKLHYVGYKDEYDSELNADWNGTDWVFREDNGQDSTIVEDAQVMGMGAAAIAVALSPPPLKAGAVIGGLIGGAIIGSVIVLHTPVHINVSAPPLSAPTVALPPRIQIVGPRPPTTANLEKEEREEAN